ncbi:Minichromosome maintenance protein MCM [Candidatus Tiddalikarchaeum anstoanum]|nr:Minichromosome maintenance protein MCM [Candidatus Tiddalikarchaeum anstoanum]
MGGIEESEVVEKFSHFISECYAKELSKVLTSGEKSLNIDYAELDKYDQEVAELLADKPEKYIKLFEESIQQVEDGVNSKIFLRFFNIPTNYFVKIKDIRSKHLGKLVFTEGIVRQASAVLPMCTKIIFRCVGCEQLILVEQEVSIIKTPEQCPNCRKRVFKIVEHKFVDTQRVILEESPETLEGGSQPMRLNIILRNDLVDPEIIKRTCPGSKIRVVGVVHEFSKPIAGSKDKSTLFDLLMEGNFIESIEREYEDIILNDDDVKQIELLSSDPDIFEKLVRSIAPSIKGKSKIKEALILQMFGGVRKNKNDGTKTRGDIHILLIGDPGTGKSQLIKSVTSIAPKSRFVSGKGASGAGLTATVVKDEILRGWALEAGALVLANKGILCIDEIDKMHPDDRSAMHEAMEQQQISIAKANVQAVLNCQTAILAAANPKYGRFDQYKPIPDQIDMPVTLLSRFDLIFPVRDIPNKKEDEELAMHILEGQKDDTKFAPFIPSNVVRKYASYARQHVIPKLTDPAIKEISDFFVNLRNKDVINETDVKPVPITPRQLEAMVRLAEASAKVRLSNTVTKEDAKRAIDLMKVYLVKLGFDPDTGEIDIDRVVSNVTSSQRSKIYEMVDLMKDLEKNFGKDLPLNEVINEAKNRGIEEAKAEEIIDKMKRSGEVFEPRNGVVRRMPK